MATTMAATMAIQRTSLQDEKCLFCLSSENNELLYGAKKRLNDIVTHYYCLLLSSSMEQKGEDTEGLLGFMLPDIQKELNRGKRLVCTYCKRTGATIGCVNGKCRKNFHLPCGIANGSLHQFFTQFKSFCPAHRPRQRIPPKILQEIEDGEAATCAICYEEVSREPSVSTIWAPCCKKSAWFHRDCVQRLAISAGYFFKCPLCNNKKEFCQAMQECGIFIPEQDASWEMVPNAFEELLHRHDRCDFPLCRNPKGRTNDEKGTRFELILCTDCGSAGSHIYCAGLKWSCPEWQCDECKSMLKDAQGRRVSVGTVPLATEESDDNSSSSSSVPSRRPTPNETPSPNVPPSPNGASASSSQSSLVAPRRTQTAKRGRVGGPNLGTRTVLQTVPEKSVVSTDDIIEILSDSDDDIEIIDVMEPEKPMELIMSDGSKIPIVQVREESTAPIVEGDVNVVGYDAIKTVRESSFCHISHVLAQRKVDIKPVSITPSPTKTVPEVVTIVDDLDNTLSKLTENIVKRGVGRPRRDSILRTPTTTQRMPAATQRLPRRSQVDDQAQKSSNISSQNVLPSVSVGDISTSGARNRSSTVTSNSVSQPSPFDLLLGTSPSKPVGPLPQSNAGILAGMLKSPLKPASNNSEKFHMTSSAGSSSSRAYEAHSSAKKSRPSELSYVLENNLDNYRKLLPAGGNPLGYSMPENPPSYEETMNTDRRQTSMLQQNTANFVTVPNVANSNIQSQSVMSYQDHHQHASPLQQYLPAQNATANSNLQLSSNVMSFQNQGGNYIATEYQQNVVYNTGTSFVPAGADSPANVIYQGGTTYLAVSSNPSPQVQGFLVTQPHVIQSYVSTNQPNQQTCFSSHPNSQWVTPTVQVPSMTVFNVPTMMAATRSVPSPQPPLLRPLPPQDLPKTMLRAQLLVKPPGGKQSPEVLTID